MGFAHKLRTFLSSQKEPIYPLGVGVDGGGGNLPRNQMETPSNSRFLGLDSSEGSFDAMKKIQENGNEQYCEHF